jgi:hypothetical protein
VVRVGNDAFVPGDCVFTTLDYPVILDGYVTSFYIKWLIVHKNCI